MPRAWNVVESCVNLSFCGRKTARGTPAKSVRDPAVFMTADPGTGTPLVDGEIWGI